MKLTITDLVGNETTYDSHDVHMLMEFTDTDIKVLNARPQKTTMLSFGSKPDISLKGIVASAIMDLAHGADDG